MSRVAILPFISVIAILAKVFLDVEIGEELQNQIVDALLGVFFVGTSVVTIVRTRKKKKNTEK